MRVEFTESGGWSLQEAPFDITFFSIFVECVCLFVSLWKLSSQNLVKITHKPYMDGKKILTWRVTLKNPINFGVIIGYLYSKTPFNS